MKGKYEFVFIISSHPSAIRHTTNQLVQFNDELFGILEIYCSVQIYFNESAWGGEGRGRDKSGSGRTNGELLPTQ